MKPNLFCYNGPDGSDPHGVKLVISESDKEAFDNLPEGTNIESVNVTDLTTNELWQVRRAPCGAGCYCAGEAVKIGDVLQRIDPTKVTDYDRTQAELELFWIFSICVAGKNADQMSDKVGKLLCKAKDQGQTPFEYLRENRHAIHNLLVAHRIGQYNRITKAIDASLDLDLKTCTVADLHGIPGVGRKTARFFLVHTRRDCDYVILDTHVLRYLREYHGAAAKWPDASPGEKYGEIEFIASRLLRADFPQMTMAEIDLLVWTRMSGRLA